MLDFFSSRKRGRVNVCGKMAANLSEVVFDLRGQTDFSERGKTFWNASELELKFSFEREWIKAVRQAKRRPNYGMGKMNSGLEEVCGNKLELCGPLVDGYLLEIGEQIASKLSRSKATSSVGPVVIFIPWQIFRRITVLLRGYSGEVKFNERKSKITSTLSCTQAVEKVFSLRDSKVRMFLEKDISVNNRNQRESCRLFTKAGQPLLYLKTLLLLLNTTSKVRRLW